MTKLFKQEMYDDTEESGISETTEHTLEDFINDEAFDDGDDEHYMIDEFRSLDVGESYETYHSLVTRIK